jgi:hypothetical protein
MPRYPAACHGSVPFCINHVAAVCRMRRNAGPELGQRHRMFERGLHGRYTFAVEFDKVPRNDLALLPASQVCQQARWDRHRRLPFVSLLLSLGASVVDATIKVDKGPPDGRGRRC